MNRRHFLTLAGTGLVAPALSQVWGAGQTVGAATRRPALSGRHALTPSNTSLRIARVNLELAKGVNIRTVGYNGTSPGPVLRFKEAEPVNIDVYNDTDVDELVHWHGLAIDSRNDGAMEEGSPMVPAHGHLRYSFTPKPSGTRWYHTHTMAGADLSHAGYTGQFGFLYIEPRHEPGQYDQEIFLAVHHWGPSFFKMGEPMNALDVHYKYASFNDKLHSAAEPIRVKFGQRVLFRLLNASATEAVQLSLPGHLFTVVAMDGNVVPQPRSVETLTLAVGERIDAIVEMNTPGVWLLGGVDEVDRARGLGRTIEYAGRIGKPIWADPDDTNFDYFRFASTDQATKPDVGVPMTFTPAPADEKGMQRWTVNGVEYSKSSPLEFHEGKRHRLVFVNASAEPHPLHLHRHSFELVSIGKQRGSGLMKDIVNIPPNTTTEVDVVADNPGNSLFHCHQQLHMDYGFMRLFKYV
jgi:FtsP/CotA-like multicopper oxidase with cupredoxin domain